MFDIIKRWFMTEKTDKKIVVLYHAECPDGFGAAWSAWKKFGGEAIYMPVYNRTLPPPEIEGREVYTLDYCYPKKVLEEYTPKMKKLTIIDHHVTAEESLPLATESVFDLEHSGAVLSWKYFHPQEAVPTLLGYIEDIDLWKFALPYSRELTQSLALYKYDFEIWDTIAADIEDPEKFQRYIEDGTLLRLKMEEQVEKAVQNAEEVSFEGYKCLMANSPFNVSEIGAALVAKQPPIGIIWSRRGEKIVVSLRSDGTADVSKIAQKYGGGGHPEAAAFGWDEKEFLKFRSG
jgi:oligoribonuclease NrnB/cAMP/cGMP phosphodiesterase (DHH superfamily)